MAMAEVKRGKAPKGSVQVSSDRGWLRLVWSYAGKRYVMAMGMPDDPINRAIAQSRAGLIYGDIITGNFDPTLEKYRPASTSKEDRLPVTELFERWVAYKSKQVEAISLKKQQSFVGHIRQFFRNRNASLVGEEDAFEFKDWLLRRNQPITVRERIGWMRSCWKWAVKRKLVVDNPWEMVNVKVPPKQKQPFNREEVALILKGFEAPEFAHYRDYVEFLLSVGCRPGEANGLRWRHLSSDCSKIWIGESIGREKRQKSTKNNKDRYFELTPNLQQILLSKKSDTNPNDLVFTSVSGQQIDDKNFCNRYWKKVLAAVGVKYRRPYNCRHSFVSNGVDQGVHPGDISAITGHSLETLYRSYLGNVRGRVSLPNLWD